MELKNYQKKTMRDLASYLHFLDTEHDMVRAYEKHWGAQDVRVGLGGMLPYRITIPGAPHVCFKVPTGGGKTFLACASIRPIFEAMPKDKLNAVIWLVPSNAILDQTIRNLSNVSHPYRQRLDFDFAGRVMVYTKEQLLNGQNFTPDTVREQLSVCVLSYDSLRSSKKDGRKVYQQNGNLASFANFFNDPSILLADTDETALIQVFRNLNPTVVVDESHNAQSDLSVEMLNNLNPSFVLDLTATPKSNSNIISFVDAREMKRENMVKLPVIVYNRTSRQDVMQDAIQLRGNIERQAIAEEQGGGSYIRPIVLFQAQPNTDEDSATFEKIRANLIGMGIPETQIAIKTSKINELKDVDLMGHECPVRYIITVNALKEGWDCPFAYILASLANKTSAVDVEQIVGRILRQPYAKLHKGPLLNESFVLTNSADFRNTLDKIVMGLNNAGFSRQALRVAEEIPAQQPPEEIPVQTTLSAQQPVEDDDFSDLHPEEVRSALENETETPSTEVATMVEEAERQSSEYNRELESNEGNGFFGGELGKMKNQFAMQAEYSAEALKLEIPQFFIQTAPSLFGGDNTLLTKEALSEGFSLNGQDAQISFELATGEIYRVDLSAHGEAVPQYQRAQKDEGQYIREYLARTPEANKLKVCIGALCSYINRNDRLATAEVNAYVRRVVEGMTQDELAALETATPTYARKIQQKIDILEEVYREKQFDKWMDNNKITCKPSLVPPKVITPINSKDSIVKSLYESEWDDMNDFEFKVINTVAALDNVKWWHRIMERKPGEFYLNGFIHHYPDFMIMTQSGKLVMIETKGNHLWNDESRAKLHLGRQWAAAAGAKFSYFMVFDELDTHENGAYKLDDFIGMIKDI
jgi:type III restriction enzyme